MSQEELKNNRLMGTRCKKCGTQYMPPRAHCKCGGTEIEWYEAPKQGRLESYTLITFPPESMTKHAPYIVAIAELGDGTRLLGHLIGVTPRNLKIDMTIQVVSHKVSEERVTFKFKPV